MVKASLRAMDTITEWTAQNMGEEYQLDYYTVSGASKRGWTTWDVGAVDPDRVQLIVPIVLDAINFADVMHHQWRSYGGWAYALKDYIEMDIMTRMDTPECEQMQAIIDPYFYRERLTMPKLVVNAVGDEFQQPDDTWYWWNDMPEPKHFLMIPNAEHSLATGIFEALPAVGTWISYHLKKKSIPSFTWDISPIHGDITVQLDNTHNVEAVTMYYAKSCSSEGLPVRRDFRLLSIDDPCTCGIGVDGNCLNLHSLWQHEVLEEDPSVPGKYVGSRPMPKQKGKWEAFLVDVTYTKDEDDQEHLYDTRLPTDMPGRLEFTTEVSVIPKAFPYDECTGDGCSGDLV
jgi:PhoPQ-activated pathogenicity-related protein